MTLQMPACLPLVARLPTPPRERMAKSLADPSGVTKWVARTRVFWSFPVPIETATVSLYGFGAVSCPLSSPPRCGSVRFVPSPAVERTCQHFVADGCLRQRARPLHTSHRLRKRWVHILETGWLLGEVQARQNTPPWDSRPEASGGGGRGRAGLCSPLPHSAKRMAYVTTWTVSPILRA